MSSLGATVTDMCSCEAVVTVDPTVIDGVLDQRVFGGLVEHVGRSIYGGVTRSVNGLFPPELVRQDVLDALRDMRVSVVRWPGGNFASGYDWRDGVGPVDQRPVRSNLSWLEEEPNTFGTNEFLAWAAELGAEPYLVVNMGSGSIDLAQAWVEYCNGSGNTYWANLRRSHGREEPYGVRYWGLGNEMYGEWQIGQMDVHEYVKKAREFSKVMLWTDPDIELVSCGRDGISDWDRVVIEELAEYVRWHSIHVYTGSTDYWTNVLSPHHVARAVRNVSSIIERVRYVKRLPHRIHVALDEWNVAYRTMDEVGWRDHFRAALDERYNLSDTVAVSTFLTTFVKLHRELRMANLGQLINALGALVTNEEQVLRQGIYHAFALFSRNAQEFVTPVTVHSRQKDLPVSEEVGPRTFRIGDLGPFDVLDAAATVNVHGDELAVWLVNRDPASPTRVEVRTQGRAIRNPSRMELLRGPEPDAVNSFRHPDQITVEYVSINSDGERLHLEIPPCGVAAVRLSLVVD